MTSCPPKPWPPTHDVSFPEHEPRSRKREREMEDVRQVMLQHLKHQLVLTGMTTWMTPCPPKPWPPTHDVPPPLHEPRTRKETKGKARGSSSNVAPHAAQTCVNWDDDMNDFIPPKPWPPTHGIPPLYMNVDPKKRERESQEVRRAKGGRGRSTSRARCSTAAK